MERWGVRGHGLGRLPWLDGRGAWPGAPVSLGSGGDVRAAGSYPSASGFLGGARAGPPGCQQPCKEEGGGPGSQVTAAPRGEHDRVGAAGTQPPGTARPPASSVEDSAAALSTPRDACLGPRTPPPTGPWEHPTPHGALRAPRPHCSGPHLEEPAGQQAPRGHSAKKATSWGSAGPQVRAGGGGGGSAGPSRPRVRGTACKMARLGRRPPVHPCHG